MTLVVDASVVAAALVNTDETGQWAESLFVDAPLDVCERRDVKGLYARARRGELREFTGLDAPCEPPLAPDLVVFTAHLRGQRTSYRATPSPAARGF